MIKRKSNVQHALSHSDLWSRDFYNFVKYEERNSWRTDVDSFVSYPRFVSPLHPSFVSTVLLARATDHTRYNITRPCPTHVKRVPPFPCFSVRRVLVQARTYSIKMKMLPRGTCTRDFECCLSRSTSYRADLLFMWRIGELCSLWPFTRRISCPLAVNANKYNGRARRNYSGCIVGNSRDKR